LLDNTPTRTAAPGQRSAFFVAQAPQTDELATPVAPFPEITTGPPERIWAEYFRNNRPDDATVRRTILKLHNQDEHEHVIHAIQSALLNGQTQPWMYEVLALSMEIVGRPKEDVQRVLLSLTDFGNANFQSTMYSAAYLMRFGREETALRLYRQASRLSPERPEPYLLGLKLARKHPKNNAVRWAATGILEYGWTKNYKRVHRDAENAVLEEMHRLREQQDEQALAELQRAVQTAQRRDLMVRLTWNGPADLDLIVEEPGGTVCSFDSPDTPGGGIHLYDGFGPTAENCREQYVCPQGLSGTYRLRIKLAWGEVVGRRAQLTVVQHAGTPNETTTKQVIVIGAKDAFVPITLEGGRRTRPRTVSTSQIDPISAAQSPRRRRHRGPIRLTGHDEAALDRFRDSRRQSAAPGGAVAFQSVIATLNEGSVLTVNPVVSADRRYVRVAVNPSFTTLTDVFTFSFISGF